MSLVNLSHVCSHLQNASLARLGLTSIPYTRLHLSLSLLLQKQGFLSQVKLAGPSPPASCFPPGEDHHGVTARPYTDRARLTPASALQRMVNWGPQGTAKSLQKEGFDDEAIEYAMSRRLKTKAQLERDGWQDEAMKFLLKYDGIPADELKEQGLDDEAIAIIQRCKPFLDQCKREVMKWHGDRESFERAQEEAVQSRMQTRKKLFQNHLQEKLRIAIIREGFDVEILRYFAGDNKFVTERELELEGVDVDVMGLTVSNQPFEKPVPKHYEDPWQLEEEGVVTQANRASRRLWLGLKYWDGMPVLSKARMLSKPKKRIWLEYEELSRLTRGKQAGEVKPLTQVGEIMAVNTNKLGLLEVRECVERKLGGMPLCRIW